MIYFDNEKFTDNEFSLYLINKYMEKYFNNKAKEEIKKKYAPKQIAKLLGERDFSFFCTYFLRDFFVSSDENTNRNLSDEHFKIMEELTKMFVLDTHDNEEFILPRGMAKTICIDNASTVWRHVYKKSRFTVIIGNKQTDAEGFIDGISAMLNNPRIKETFGQLIDKKDRSRVCNKSELELQNDTDIQCFGIGSSIRGISYSCAEGRFRPSTIILDDILSEEDILTEGAKEKVVNKFYKEILEAGDKKVIRDGKKIQGATKIIICNTPLAQDDFCNTIRNDPTFKIYWRRVCDFNVDEYFTNNKYWNTFKEILFDPENEDCIKTAQEFYINNEEFMKFETIWEKYNCCDIATRYFTERVSFLQELMCDCENVGERLVESLISLPRTSIENKNFKNVIMAIDPATTTSRRSDYTAISIVGKAGFHYYVRRGYLEKFDSRTEFDKYINFCVDVLKEYPEITHIVIEKNVFKGIDSQRIQEAIEQDSTLRRRNIQIIDIYNTKNKDERISTIIQKINSGQIVFNEECKEYNNQVKTFRGQLYTLHDDAIDCLQMAVNHIDTLIKNRKIVLFDKNKLF